MEQAGTMPAAAGPQPETEAQAQQLERRAAAFQIVDQPTATQAADLGGAMASFIKTIEAERRGWVDPLNGTVGRINAAYRELREPLLRAKQALSDKLTIWQREQREAQRRRQAEIEAEQRRQRKQAEAEALERAEQLEREGHKAAAEVVLGVAAAAPPPSPQPAPMQSPVRGKLGGGFNTRKDWVYKVEDIKALAAARPDLVLANDKLIRAMVVSGGVRELPGVKIFQKETGVLRR